MAATRATRAAKRAAPAKAEQRAGNTLVDKLARLGITRDQDLVLHLPLRYEDHTQLVAPGALASGQSAQTEGTVVTTDIQYRPRRQLVSLLRGDDQGQVVLRFFSFYPNQQKALAPGHRIRAYGEVRDGYFGLEIVHPQFKVVTGDTALPDRLTP
ncbi:MAG TPA: OB-fold nucleic acid binding domain-containing protein, partial [Casimicrobiaceae bacterium]|nr:OB-fold nucleic acid binding domain-containing protein [Casimicrobiaceae bacterium]